jgi:hypothetical protein
MDENSNHNPGNVPPSSAEFGTMQNGSESFRTVPKASASFGTVRNDSERFGKVPHASERQENHTLTVREAARLFEAAGVARTERSITNWCQPNRTGVARLDAYYDPNERKYYISPQSVELAIAEEKAKVAKVNEPAEPSRTLPQDAESFRTIPNDADTMNNASATDESHIRELERENWDLKIANRGKDYLIEQIQKERTGFFDQLLNANRRLGELENKLLPIESSRRGQLTEPQNGASSGN